MKNFLKKLFFTDHPAQGVFTGFTLLLAALWIVPALILLQGDFPLNLMPFRATFFTVSWLDGILLAVLYALTVWIQFYCQRRAAEKIPWNAPGRLALYAVALLSVLVSGWIFLYYLRSGYSEERSLAGAAVLVFLILVLWCPLFLFPGNWKIILARGVCLSAAVCGCFAAVYASQNFSVLGLHSHLCCFDDYFTGPAWWLYPAAFAGVFLWILAYVLTARMYAQMAQLPVRKIFSRATVIILGLWAGVYLISLGMAYAEHCRSERTMAELEKHFGRPVSLEALNAAYCQNRPVDEAFWQQVRSCIEQAYPSDRKSGMDVMISGTPDGIYPESVFRRFKSVFGQSEPRKKIERMLNRRRLPARKLRILSGDITCLDLSELNWCRDICRWELWQVRFALADGKLADACAAMERMKRVADYLGNRTNSLIMTIVLIACERYRMLGFERLLASGQVPDELLKQWAAELERDEKAVPGIHFDTVYSEAVFADSVIRSAAHGGTDSNGRSYPGRYGLRYLYPPMWYFCTLDRNRYMKCFKIRSFGEMGWPGKRPGILQEMMLPASQSADKKIMVLTACYRAMRALIGIELEKRRTGKYPDTLDNPPVDPFTGKPMIYRKGRITVNDPVWIGGREKFDNKAVRQAEGVEIVSAGPNRKNDVGARLIFNRETAN
ncbi:MAG: hypothetical protein E7055_08845 [Lentisphaerae bacterium]|nr:hypothetical protein [Lentisphaerota bacterium]